jgi:hypothetical protein
MIEPLTSRQEDPWKLTPKDEIIPMEVMKEYYKNLKDEND